MDQFSLMVYLQPGDNEIKINKDFQDMDGCGLIPLGTPVNNISTTGLKWNLNE